MHILLDSVGILGSRLPDKPVSSAFMAQLEQPTTRIGTSAVRKPCVAYISPLRATEAHKYVCPFICPNHSP
jgi:hypothetical protein